MIFSIIIPLYNKEKHIKATLQSVFEQTLTNFEIIIVNDGSTDNSLAVVDSIKDERIKLFSIENQGVSCARNYGISKASSNLIAFLDADDYWFPNHLEQLRALYEKFPDCGLYAVAYANKMNNRIYNLKFHAIPEKLNWMGIVEDYFESSKGHCIAWTSAIMIPTDILNAIGGFDERIILGAGEDTDLWMRIALKHSIAFSNTVSAIHNLQADNRITNSNTNLRTFINLDAYEDEAKTNKSLKKYLDLNRFSIAIQYKLAGNNTKAKTYIDKIDKTNLNTKQCFLLDMNAGILRVLVHLQKLLKKGGIGLSAFR